MSEPIVFISTHKIKEGQLHEFKKHSRRVAESIEAEKPGTVVFLAYLNEDRTEVSTVHVFPDAESMEFHMEGLADRTKEAAEFVEFRRLEVYGTPSDKVQEIMQRATGSGGSFTITPELFTGYLRLQSG